MADKAKRSNRAGSARAGRARAGGGLSDGATPPLPPRRNPDPVSESVPPLPQGNSFEVAAQVVRDNAEQQRRRGGALIGSMGLNTATLNEFPAGGTSVSGGPISGGGRTNPEGAGYDHIVTASAKTPDEDEVSALLRKLRGFQAGLHTWITELRASIRNEPDEHAKDLSLIAFLENLTNGLAEVSDGLEQAIRAGSGGTAEPILLGKAAITARKVSEVALQWLEEQGTNVIDVPVKLGLFGSTLVTLSHFGLSSDAITGVVGGIIIGAAISGKGKSS